MDYIIEVNNLVKNYGNVKAVKGISFKVKKGAFFAFLGENGAGKSTTINILCTVLTKTSGEVKVCGYDLDTERDLIRESIGIVFQGSVLDGELTVYENLKCRASLYGYNKYIPAASRIVHAIHEDEWSDIRLSGQFIKSRKIISDKSFIDEKEDCDKLPFLDYRLMGKNNREEREYYAGYME
jgi:ABC-type multidrug transport system ATPase subunit